MFILCTKSVINPTVWIDSNEFVIKFSIANFAHAFIPDYEVRLFELVGLLFGVKSLLVWKLARDKSVLSLCKSSVKHVNQIRNDVVFPRIDIPFIRNMSKNRLVIQIVSTWIFLQQIQPLSFIFFRFLSFIVELVSIFNMIFI